MLADDWYENMEMEPSLAPTFNSSPTWAQGPKIIPLINIMSQAHLFLEHSHNKIPRWKQQLGLARMNAFMNDEAEILCALHLCIQLHAVYYNSHHNTILSSMQRLIRSISHPYYPLLNNAWLKLNVDCTAQILRSRSLMSQCSEQVKIVFKNRKCSLPIKQLPPFLSHQSLEWSKGQSESLQTLTDTVQHQ